MPSIDLTPFGFTPTESLAYATLLRLGPATGYEVGREARLARANAYTALEGLVRGGAAARAGERPVRYRAADPTSLLARFAARQGEALERLSRALAQITLPAEPGTQELQGLRATANVVTQLVARATQRVEGVVTAALWGPTLPAWRRAVAHAALSVRVAGEVPEVAGIGVGRAPDDAGTLLLVDGVHVVVAEGDDVEMTALWSSHPLLARVAGRALAAGEP